MLIVVKIIAITMTGSRMSNSVPKQLTNLCMEKTHNTVWFLVSICFFSLKLYIIIINITLLLLYRSYINGEI